jgi:hypothetical protein
MPSGVSFRLVATVSTYAAAATAAVLLLSMTMMMMSEPVRPLRKSFTLYNPGILES